MTKTTDITVPAQFAKLAHEYAWLALKLAEGVKEPIDMPVPVGVAVGVEDQFPDAGTACEPTTFSVGDIVEYATDFFVTRRYGTSTKYIYGTIKEMKFNKAEIEWEDGSTGCVSLARLLLVSSAG